MQLSENWLREWVNPQIDSETLQAQLTMLGLEVDDVVALTKIDELVVAEIVGVEQHPDADKLKICSVDDGSGQTVQVVCGAPNARLGIRIPFARVGCTLPGGLKIKKAKLRGVESFGMLCSERRIRG